ncbi:MAG TPA: cell division protein ZapE [Oxalicibacterium sp.]|jgi:cell division protein ZapE|nr:cell division protein ZapE [Oxalicibacterium sp.]
MNVREYYRQALTQRGFQPDAAQQKAVDALQNVYDGWLRYEAARAHFLQRWLRSPKPPRGIYMWGGVGRGKSFLMDSFYSVAPVERKTRVHFHEFMRGVHRELDSLKSVADPLEAVAARIAARYELICFDEFHVTDIADAMILYNLLKPLFARGVSFVVTSNFHPDTLYPDGLHRDRLLPAIELLKQNLLVLNVDGGNDYRKLALAQVEAYLTPAGEQADRALGAAFDRIAETADDDPEICIETRAIRALRRAGGVIWFDFATLCGGARSQNDYLEIASRFHTVILSDVPAMSSAMSSEARRFIWLIDVLYDRRIKLLLSADVGVDGLYTAGSQKMEFQRAISRLTEMQSLEYMEAGRRYADGASWQAG